MHEPVIIGFGTAVPETIDQRFLWTNYFREHFNRCRMAERVFDHSGVRRRHAVLNPVVEDCSGWSTGARMVRYAESAPPLGNAAVRAAIADAGLTATDIGMLVVASCTGYCAPGLDIRLANALELRPNTRRLFIGHMGCYASLPALASVADFVTAHGRPAVLLCIELPSLHIQPPTTDPQQAVCHALFSDAAVALVVQPVTGTARGLQLVDTAWVTDTAHRDEMTWNITDLGFRMGLSASVPDVLGAHVEDLVSTLLSRHGLRIADIAEWAIHPGGPRILQTVQRRLALPERALDHSRQTLAEHGNCSSATLPMILHRLCANGSLHADDSIVALGFGPGLTLTAALFHTN